MEISEALDRLYAGAMERHSVTMREFLSGFSTNAAAAQALTGGADKKSHAYKAAIRDVQRYQNYISGRTDRQSRNPDNVRVSTLRRAGRAAAVARARRGGIIVSEYRGKIATSPKRKKGRLIESRDRERERSISNVVIRPKQIDSDVLAGDVGAFSDAFLDAYGAGPIGELYDIEDLELEFADLDDEGDDEDEGGDDE